MILTFEEWLREQGITDKDMDHMSELKIYELEKAYFENMEKREREVVIYD